MKTFRHSTNERNKSEVLRLRMTYGAAGYGIYMMLLERLAEEPDLRAALDYDILAYEFHADAEMIQHIVEDFDLFIIDLDDQCFHHAELDKQLPKRARQQLQETIVDKFIRSRLNNSRWIDSTAETHKTTSDTIRTFPRSSFRARALEDSSKIPDDYLLSCLLATLLSQYFRC